jgi:hypothetical protein
MKEILELLNNVSGERATLYCICAVLITCCVVNAFRDVLCSMLEVFHG